MGDTENLGNSREVMDSKLRDAAMKGNLASFVKDARNNEIESGLSEEYFLSQTSDSKENILHLAIGYEQKDFIEKVVKGELLPKAVTDELIKQQDKFGDTPLHDAARVSNFDIFKLVLEYDHTQAKVKNRKGNMPLHVAVSHVRVESATFLLDHHLQLARATNSLKETPLHLAIKKYKHIISSWKLFTDDEQGLNTNVASWLANQTMKVYDLTKLLLEKDKSVACLHDIENMTPLHRAAFLVPTFGVGVVKLIVNKCPESSEVKDDFDQTILHYMINCVTSYKTGKELLKIREINSLRNSEDKAGETPLDRAWKMNIKMVRALLDSPLQLNDPALQQNVHDPALQQNVHDPALQQNVHDHSASPNVFAQKLNDFEMVRRRRRKMEEYGVVDGVHLQFLKSKLRKFGNDFLFSRDSKGRNLLHNLLQLERGSPIIKKGFYDFILQVADSHPKLVCQTDFSRDTPIHVLMRNSLNTKICVNTDDHSGQHIIETLEMSKLVPNLLALCCKYFQIAKTTSTNKFQIAEKAGADNQPDTEIDEFKYNSPWLVQNGDGNTPLHEAFKAKHINSIRRTLLKLDTHITAKMTNKYKETPLHVLAGSSLVEWPEQMCDLIKELVNANTEAALSRDENGLTPMLRAIQAGNIKIFAILDGLYFPAADNNHHELNNDIKSAIDDYLQKDGSKSNAKNLAEKLLVDDDDHTLWHMLLKQPDAKTHELVQYVDVTKPHLIGLLKKGDKEGKTPLHLALEDRQFKHARCFLQCSHQEGVSQTKKLLDEKDEDGITPGDLLASFTDHPKKLDDLWNDLKDVPGIKDYRSMYDISTSEIKDYVNTMGVIAALLATITFTAALTVPGGIIQDAKDEKLIGTPLLVNMAAFQAFMFFDISSMCLSTMVLFCLLWILAAGNKRNSLMLMDFSIWLLSISFHSTLLTFMAGVYATTIHVKPWIAIYTLVFCSLLMLLMHKELVVRFLAPYGHKLRFGIRLIRWMKRVFPTFLSKKERHN